MANRRIRTATAWIFYPKDYLILTALLSLQLVITRLLCITDHRMLDTILISLSTTKHESKSTDIFQADMFQFPPDVAQEGSCITAMTCTSRLALARVCTALAAIWMDRPAASVTFLWECPNANTYESPQLQLPTPQAPASLTGFWMT